MNEGTTTGGATTGGPITTGIIPEADSEASAAANCASRCATSSIDGRSALSLIKSCSVNAPSSGGTSGASSHSDGGGLNMCMPMRSCAASPTKGGRPASISNSTVPSE